MQTSLVPHPRHTRHRSLRSVALALTVAAAALAATAVPAGATPSVSFSPQQILEATNAERTRHGLPALTLRGDWSSSCAKHVRWIEQNGVLAHEEEPGTAGYSPEGDWAGTHAILASGSPWSRGNPFATAPIHLNQLMAPQLRAIGAWEKAGTSCLTTWPGMRLGSSATPRFHSWPGDGATGVAPAVQATEMPFVPGQFVGLPPGSLTGPNMMVYAVGWDRVRIVSATLRPAGGDEVDVRTVDRSHPTIGPYLVPGSGFVIPAKPLFPSTAYTVAVRVRNLGTGAVRGTSWRFRTGGAGDAATLSLGG